MTTNAYYKELTKIVEAGSEPYRINEFIVRFGIPAAEVEKDMKLVRHNLAQQEGK